MFNANTYREKKKKKLQKVPRNIILKKLRMKIYINFNIVFTLPHDIASAGVDIAIWCIILPNKLRAFYQLFYWRKDKNSNRLRLSYRAE